LNNLGRVLDGEWLLIVSCISVLPGPARCIIKRDITRDDHALVGGIVASVRFAPQFIPDEDGFAIVIIEFFQTQPCDLDMRDAPECAKEVHGQGLAMPSFIWGLAIDVVCGWSVEDVDSHSDCLPPEVARQLLSLEQTSCHGDYALVLPLHHPVLLWRVRGSELMVDVVFGTMLHELDQCELSPTISAEYLQLYPRLNLYSSLKVFDLRRRLILARK
jgi:hypothetical protein